MFHKVLFMSSSKFQDDLSEIRSIMERSTKFLSLSPWSAIMAGVYAIAGAAIAFRRIYPTNVPDNPSRNQADILTLAAIAATVLFASAITAIAVNYKKAKANGQNLWNAPAQRAFINFAIPMAAGGIFSIILVIQGYFTLIAASTLIFYGLALVNTGNFTFTDIRILGLWQLALGLLAAALPSYGLAIWTIGFGFLHLAYGGILYWKYDRKPGKA